MYQVGLGHVNMDHVHLPQSRLTGVRYAQQGSTWIGGAVQVHCDKSTLRHWAEEAPDTHSTHCKRRTQAQGGGLPAQVCRVQQSCWEAHLPGRAESWCCQQTPASSAFAACYNASWSTIKRFSAGSQTRKREWNCTPRANVIYLYLWSRTKVNSGLQSGHDFI